MVRRGKRSEQALAERFRPLLILYPEISSQTRRKRPNWRPSCQAPLYEDYHPRDVRLVLDHAHIPGRAAPHDGEQLLDELESNPKIPRIDILAGIGPREKFWAQYYGIVNKIGEHGGDDTYPCSAYVHVAHGDDVASEPPPMESVSDYRGLIAIDYWFIYLYNDWKSVHEGDWEHIVVVVKEAADPQGQPEAIACAYSVHDIGYRLPWRDVEKADDQGERADQGTHPVVYVANGSHANYFCGPCHYFTRAEMFGVRVKAGEFPFTGEFTDYTTSFEEGARVLPEAKVVPVPVGGRWAGEWRWLNFSGRWGSRGAGWLCPGSFMLDRCGTGGRRPVRCLRATTGEIRLPGLTTDAKTLRPWTRGWPGKAAWPKAAAGERSPRKLAPDSNSGGLARGLGLSDRLQQIPLAVRSGLSPDPNPELDILAPARSSVGTIASSHHQPFVASLAFGTPC